MVDQVENTPAEQRQAAVGVLTTEHRDTWGPVGILCWLAMCLLLTVLSTIDP